MRDFAREQGITHYYEVGCMGVEHALLPEQGVVGAGDLIIGADSHTCTYGALGAFATGVGSTDAGVGYATGQGVVQGARVAAVQDRGRAAAPGVTGKDVILHIIGMIGVDGALYQAMEFTGSAIRTMGMDERMSISNMAIEAGGKAGLIEVDDVTRAYMDGRTERPYTEYHSDPDAMYAKVYEIDAASIVPDGRRSRICRRTRARSPKPATSRSTRPSSAPARTAASSTCARPPTCCAGGRSIPTCAAS